VLATASEQTRGEATTHNTVIRPTALPLHQLFSRNPLLRASDRIETAAVTMAALLVVAAAVCAGVHGTLIYGAETQNYREQAQTRHAVVATVVGDSNRAVPPETTAFTVDAQWQANSINHVGVIDCDDAVKAGDRLQIWVDANGNPVARTTPPGLAAAEAVTAAVVAWLIMVLAAAPVVAAVHAHASHMREAQQEQDIRGLVNDDGGRTNPSQ
jgi:predicted secreted protein